MASKERVLQALRRTPLNRTPTDFAGTPDTILGPEAHFRCTGCDAVLERLGTHLRTVKPRCVGPRPQRSAPTPVPDVLTLYGPA